MFLFLVLLLLPSGGHPNPEEQVIFDRIAYISGLKRFIDQSVWKGFGDQKFDLPLVYYTDRFCYVANPTNKFIASFKPDLVFEGRELKIYKTKLLDSIPFHMETSTTFGDPSSAYNHKSPFMNCSSFEITQKTIPDVNSTEQWATMVLHEYFHGFQFKHPAHLAYFGENIAVAADTLHNVYKAHGWFKESVDQENAMLLAALDADAADETKIQHLIDSFFLFREQRRRQTEQQLNFDVKQIEQSYETMEGTARYAEYSLYGHFAGKNPDGNLLKSDTAYHSYQYFRNHTLEKDKWLYRSEQTRYFYATGFNLVRLFEKLKINYQARLFKEGDLSLEQILAQHRTKKWGSGRRVTTPAIRSTKKYPGR
ncbi:MAG: hypothetical protein ICV83_08815 [Cytophagales bacterium]|nr:hypothetical protein [Cytophagales bacterium]